MYLPLVSIRIPAYNHEQFIERCLEGVYKDTYPNKELVIIDDGSTDSTPDLIRNWIAFRKPTFPVTFKARPNKGLTKTLNELVALCKGEYLVSLASDDYLLAGGIEARVQYLETHPDKYAVIGDCIVVDQCDQLLFKSGLTDFYSADVENYLKPDTLLKEIISNWSVPGPVLMVRSGIYKKIGKYSEALEVEDWDLYIRMASKQLLGFINYKVSAYRLHENNTCLRPDKQIWSHKQRFRTAAKNLLRVPMKFKGQMFRQLALYFYLAYIQKVRS